MTVTAQIVDLHCHSTQSDGILSPKALVSRASAVNVAVLALTDHDTISGLHDAHAQAQVDGVRLINGCEFSCQWQGRTIHIVALDFDQQHPVLRRLLDQQAQRRESRNRAIAERLQKVGFDEAYIKALAQLSASGDQSAQLGRPHFAKAMVAEGFVGSETQAFSRYLGSGKLGDVKQHWPDIDEVVTATTAASGTAVLAHPLKYSMTRTKLRALTAQFAEFGGRAIEVVSGVQNAAATRDMAQLAKRFQLMASCGSDFHAPAWSELGRFSALPEGLTAIWEDWLPSER